MRCKVGPVANAMVCIAALPDGKLGAEPVREATLNQLYGAFQRDDLWCKQQMHVVGHNDKVVQLVVTFAKVVLQGIEEEFGVPVYLEEDGGDCRLEP